MTYTNGNKTNGITALIQATVKYPAGTPKDFGNGERINVVALTSAGEEIKLWGNPNDAIQYLRRGQTIAVIQSGKGYKLIATTESEQNPPAAPPTTETQWSNEHKQKILTELKTRAKILAHCHRTIEEEFKGDLDPETIQKYATTLYLDLKNLWK